MLRQLLVGAAVSLGNIAIHALVMTAVVNVALAVSSRKASAHPLLLLMSVMIATVSVLMAAPTVYFGSTKLPNRTRPHWLSIM